MPLDEGLIIHEQEVVEKIETSGSILQIDIHQTQNHKNHICAGSFSRTVNADYLVAAIGQESSLTFATSETIIKAGDFAHGAASVAEALASGRCAAEITLEKLEINSAINLHNSSENQTVVESQQLHQDYFDKRPAINVTELKPADRKESFTEVRQSLNLTQMQSEIERCFSLWQLYSLRDLLVLLP